MEVRELTCVACPMGCQMTASIENGVVVSVTGNTCPRGTKYAETECTHPVRPLTTTVKVEGGRHPVVEQMMRSESFVPNDTTLDQKNQRIAGVPEAVLSRADELVGQLMNAAITDAIETIAGAAGGKKKKSKILINFLH